MYREARQYLSTYEADIPFETTREPFSERLASAHLALQGALEVQKGVQVCKEGGEALLQELSTVFDKIEEKIDKLELIAEGFQRLNTNELGDDTIHSFRVLSTEELSLPRTALAKHFKPRKVHKANIEGEELFKINGYNGATLVVVPHDPENTEVVRVDILDAKGNRLSQITHKGKLPEDARQVKVFSNNIDKDKPFYTTLTILDNTFQEESEIFFEESFEKEGDVLKLIIDHYTPPTCSIEVVVSSGGVILKELGKYMYDISKLPQSFPLSVRLSLATSSPSFSPEIKGIYAYVTKRIH